VTTPLNTTTQNEDSLTKVHSVQNLFSGVRKPRGFRVDTGLWTAFKSVAKAKSGSICSAIEPMLIAYLGLADKEVHFGNTVRIEHLHIERNLRERRHLVVEKAPVVAPVEPKCDFCGKAPVVGTFRHVSGVERRACSYHASQIRNHEKWKEKGS